LVIPEIIPPVVPWVRDVASQCLVELGDEGRLAAVPLPQVGKVGGETGLVAGAVVGVPQASDGLDRSMRSSSPTIPAESSMYISAAVTRSTARRASGPALTASPADGQRRRGWSPPLRGTIRLTGDEHHRSFRIKNLIIFWMRGGPSGRTNGAGLPSK
jgi:hypothetical protein